jgi:Arc/MetJ family transcription regulator
MSKRVEIEIDDDLVQEVMRRYRLRYRSDAVHLALRTLLGETEGDGEQQGDFYDEFSDPNAWVLHRRTGAC